jgi:hypothetical protein
MNILAVNHDFASVNEFCVGVEKSRRRSRGGILEDAGLILIELRWRDVLRKSGPAGQRRCQGQKKDANG